MGQLLALAEDGATLPFETDQSRQALQSCAIRELDTLNILKTTLLVVFDIWLPAFQCVGDYQREIYSGQAEPSSSSALRYDQRSKRRRSQRNELCSSAFEQLGVNV